MFSLVDLQTPHPNLLVGTNTFDDAGVFKLNDEMALVQTVDYFTPVVDDPYAFGQIAAANALSDVYAMGAVPTTVLNIVGYPISKLPPEILARILEGGADKVREAGAVIVGGHSIDDTDPKFGMAVTGICRPDQIWTNSGAQPGDALILTKPLGAGVMTTAIKRGLASEHDIQVITEVMASLNKTSAEVARTFTVHACTDITGFGLLGHGLEMARGSGVRMTIHCGQVPILPQAFDYVRQGAVPGGTKRNLSYVSPHVNFADRITDVERILLVDSITSGGLLLSVPAPEAEALVDALHARGVEESQVIGEVMQGDPQIDVV